MDLEGKVALVTGASRGVGAAIAVALAEAGCRVACAARSTAEQPQSTPGTLDETVARIRALGEDALAVPTNLADRDAVRAMVETTAAHFGRLDVLVNNAAITFAGDLDLPMKRHDLMMEVNLNAPIVAVQAAVPHMKRIGEGAIVNLSSLAAMNSIDGMMSYGISKIGLEHFSVDAARQLQPHNIAVNCFRIDIPCASEGFVLNRPDADHSTWEPCEVPAEGLVWMLRQPPWYSGRRESMFALSEREGIMKSRLDNPVVRERPNTELANGLA